jgi:hypothetical protein
MTWWKKALYDTCSLLTLDKLLLERAALVRHFPRSILALEKSFTVDQLRRDTARRMKAKVTIQELPSTTELTGILSSAVLPKALAEVDTLIYATAVHYGLSVVTGDRQLGRAVRDKGCRVADMALILRELVHSKRLTASGCERLLQGLAHRNDFLLRSPSPTWAELEKHTFPDR